MGANIKQVSGFTLVEISIVMIIIGLLIGGTFGGMKLIDNMHVNRTIQDLKAIESAAMTFKDAYGRLPGDIVNPAARLPNCTVAPCATGGNGNRVIQNLASWNEPLTPTMEKYTFWHHIQSANLLSLGTNNTTDMSFGQGQPTAPIGGGYRMTAINGNFVVSGAYQFTNSVAFIGNLDAADLNSSASWIGANSCELAGALDNKIDDGNTYNGLVQSWGNCGTSNTATATYTRPSESAAIIYDFRGF